MFRKCIMLKEPVAATCSLTALRPGLTAPRMSKQRYPESMAHSPFRSPCQTHTNTGCSAPNYCCWRWRQHNSRDMVGPK